MNKNYKKTLAFLIFVFLISFALSAAPRFPSGVYCEKDCSVYENDSSLCDNCFVQIIYTRDNVINSPNKQGGPTEDDILLDYRKTGGKDFGTGKFSFSLDLVKGDKIYTRVWDGNDVEDSEYFGESEIIFINNSRGDYFFESFSLNKQLSSLPSLSSFTGGGSAGSKERVIEDIRNRESLQEYLGEGSEEDYYSVKDLNKSDKKQEPGKIQEDKEEKKYKGWYLLILLILAMGLLFLFTKKRKRFKFKKSLFKKKRYKNGEKIQS